MFENLPHQAILNHTTHPDTLPCTNQHIHSTGVEIPRPARPVSPTVAMDSQPGMETDKSQKLLHATTRAALEVIAARVSYSIAQPRSHTSVPAAENKYRGSRLTLMHQLLPRNFVSLLLFHPDAPSCTARTIHPPEVARRHIPPIAWPAAVTDPELTRMRTRDHAQGDLGGEVLKEEVVVVEPLEDLSLRNCCRNLHERGSGSCWKTAGSVADTGRLCLWVGERT